MRGRRDLFELLTLEGMQAGLSWLTILKKRSHMREVFHGFELDRLAAAGDEDVEVWLHDAGIIRHRGKLNAMIGNARCFVDLEDPAQFLWSFVDGAPLQNAWNALSSIPSQTTQSRTMSKALKKLGFKFVGPTICYAFMQSAGMVNDHVVGCFRHAELSAPDVA